MHHDLSMYDEDWLSSRRKKKIEKSFVIVDDELFEKGAAAKVGETHQWADGPHTKVAPNKWEPAGAKKPPASMQELIDHAKAARAKREDTTPVPDIPNADLFAAMEGLIKDKKGTMSIHRDPRKLNPAETRVLDALSTWSGSSHLVRHPEKWSPDPMGEHRQMFAVEFTHTPEYEGDDRNLTHRFHPTINRPHLDAMKKVMQALAARPMAKPTPIMRGLAIPNNQLNDISVGDEIDLGDMSSFTTDAWTSEHFATKSVGWGTPEERKDPDKARKAVVIHLNATRGTDIQELSSWGSEKEVVTGGKVRVVKKEITADRSENEDNHANKRMAVGGGEFPITHIYTEPV